MSAVHSPTELFLRRDFGESETPSGPRVVVVNETLARRLAPDGNALGKRLRMDSKGEYLEVVGVAKDIKYNQLAEKTPYFAYRPLAQQYRAQMTLHVRTMSDPQAVMGRCGRRCAPLILTCR